MRLIATFLPQNEGPADRVIRVTLGAILLALVFNGPKSAWGLVGLLPLATGLLGSCPAYRLVGVSTRPSCEGPGTGKTNAERPADSHYRRRVTQQSL